jgi:hypothetical protein
MHLWWGIGVCKTIRAVYMSVWPRIHVRQVNDVLLATLKQLQTIRTVQAFRQ